MPIPNWRRVERYQADEAYRERRKAISKRSYRRTRDKRRRAAAEADPAGLGVRFATVEELFCALAPGSGEE